MSKTKIRNIYIGVAWPYVNDLFHIGNLAGAYLPPDIFSRFHKLKGNKVLMVSGSDFHGTPITIRAEQERKKPEEIAERYHKLDKEYLQKFNIDYDLYTSTHTSIHKKMAQKMFLESLKKGFISIKKTEQLYSEKSKKFLQDRYIEGECPYCHNRDARGDQCEKCGRALDALELINPISKVDKSPLIQKTTENYFLNLSKLQKEIKRWLLLKKEIREWERKEVLGWIQEGLKPRAITRDIDYGVPLPVSKIPKNKRIKNILNKRYYVWYEAVVGYLSAAIEYSQRKKKPNYWKEFFYKKDGETYYFAGQDNLVFHLINWPAQLIAYDKKINLPANVFVNRFLFLEGQKMSKSRGWFIETPYLVERYPIDAVRFYLAFNMPEKKELNFTWRDFIETNNNILVAVIGNFIHRLLTFSQKNFDSKFDISSHILDPGVKSLLNKTFKKVAAFLEKGEFRASLQEIMNLASFGNRYVDRHQIWKLVKENPKRTKTIVLNGLAIIEALRILLYPFLPGSMEELNRLLGHRQKFIFQKGKSQWVFSEHPEPINLTSEIIPLFPKIDEKNIDIEVRALHGHLK
ncbi:MAG: methionine--tRNA ligase [Candidatus Nealsonbacteria bacterium CG02_land_8_20_14_3_00_34_20]|uniref:Methionine--tRNA ligase n=2 Tax=Candidatus Nealsoniibacteriota TaxID=1817911 RepID=A0A2M7DBG8_9BACT|nr:MAG: methionine--tRNA ligase [Candidatus Nealsonbacteria bacterium CG11_big_fil_rev_8_21_14_0_20_35_11]PIV45809.1 MAG: methionine--tRNA ligase [Candidatus Nealsonbacteria bacterium CG02_land_8_20_14_3_00_34_20]PIW92457.1 MAG: methionine--tRNA ligase [Candidatus Nealsonbacteria bacterium CG_4_8_14_3_um_filter_34_13]